MVYPKAPIKKTTSSGKGVDQRIEQRKKVGCLGYKGSCDCPNFPVVSGASAELGLVIDERQWPPWIAGDPIPAFNGGHQMILTCQLEDYQKPNRWIMKGDRFTDVYQIYCDFPTYMAPFLMTGRQVVVMNVEMKFQDGLCHIDATGDAARIIPRLQHKGGFMGGLLWNRWVAHGCKDDGCPTCFCS